MHRSAPLLLAGLLACASAPADVDAAKVDQAPPSAALEQSVQEASAKADVLIAEGRRLLDLRKPTEAEGVFLQAEELEPGVLRTHMWVLRARMDQGGHSNDVLNELDELRRAHGGPDLDYLYGMAFARRAEEQLAADAPQALEMNFRTAVELLSAATQADPDRYYDAFLPLARAGWYTQELDVARAAAEEALRRSPGAETAFELGRVALSQYVATKDDPALAAEADTHWDAARDGFRRAVQESGTPGRLDRREQGLLASAQRELGHTLMWKDQKEDALKAYGKALEWDPAGVDLAWLYQTFGAKALNETLEAAAPAFVKRFGASDKRDAALLWWLGYTRYAERRTKEAEEALLRSVEKAPQFVNAWHYIALARYEQRDYEGALKAVSTGWETDPAALVAEMSRGGEIDRAKIEYVISWCVERERWSDAAMLAELLAEAAKDVARYWNNLGFFLREEGTRLSKLDEKKNAADAQALWERSLTAYKRALELVPDDPVYLNDAAVILHYYLDRDLETALAWYVDAAKRAEEKLAAGGLSADDEELARTALRDATNNRRLIEEILKKREQAPGGEEQSSGAAAEPPGENPR